MTEAQKINRRLRRNILSGSQYDKLFPSYIGTDYKFEKKSQLSDTYDSLEFMASWVDKYYSQAKKIAPVLKGATLQETVDNIYQFLYKHFQYKLDETVLDQKIYAPSAAWHFRKTGFDCKSFSVTASAILTNLSIPHAFRMVIQPDDDYFKFGVMPEWSHVYVIVPAANNKYHVIDATTHDNTEVSFLKKQDRYMKVLKHKGLAGPQFNGLGCACDGKPISRTGLGNPQVLGFAISNFHQYLNSLESQGISREKTNEMLNMVRANVEAGIDPNIDQVVRRVLLNQGGLGFIATATAVASTLGINVPGVSDIKNILVNLIPTAFIGSTFGAVFANGFDLTCWNASWPPDKVKADIQKYHKPYYTYLANAIGSATTIASQEAAVNQFIRDVYIMQAHYKHMVVNGSKFAACTLKGFKIWLSFMDALKTKADEIVSSLQSQGAQVTMYTHTPVKVLIPKSITGVSDKTYGAENPASRTVDIPKLKLSTLMLSQGQTPGSQPQPQISQTTVPQGSVLTPNGDGSYTATDPQGNTYTTDERGIILKTGKTPASAINTTNILIGAGVVAAAFFLVAPQFKNGKPKLGKPTTRRKKVVRK